MGGTHPIDDKGHRMPRLHQIDRKLMVLQMTFLYNLGEHLKNFLVMLYPIHFRVQESILECILNRWRKAFGFKLLKVGVFFLFCFLQKVVNNF